MKTFKDLKIGDIIYEAKDNYEAKEKLTLTKHEIYNLTKEKDTLRINEYRGYNTSWLISDLIQNLDTDYYVRKDTIFTTDENKVKLLLKDIGMRVIKDYERQIEVYKKLICNTRVIYSDYLNYK